jgi:S-DNA-T family DNA segregation ATPase FtsK/SpoIIIE
MEAQLDQLGRILVEKLGTFNVECHLGGRTTGPVVTQFEVIPAPGVKVNRIANLDADLALAMKAPSIRIVAPIPGKGAVGVEIPNPHPEIVHLREVLESPEYTRTRGQLPMALGKDLAGRPYVADLAKMPHLLIAGATGSGKSVCVNTIITSLIYRHTPETLRLLMIDPKMVELSTYADVPHLRHPVVTDPSEAAGVLRWAVLEMERRYELLHANGVRSLGEFNQRVRDGVVLRRPMDVSADEEDDADVDEDRWLYDDGVMSHIVVVVDELADLMMQVQGEVERPLAQLAQKARAIGIHLIVATQRPSVNVITGLIKANFPTRIAFRVASKTDSRTILDQNGAEALLGNGDMLFLPPGQGEPVRIQGAYIATEETDRLISWYRAQEAHRLEEIEERGAQPASDAEPDILAQVRHYDKEAATAILDEGLEDRDELFRAAAEVCIQQDQGSTSLLQRRLRVGYGRAARIVDQLHEAGVLGPPDGSKPREVLVGYDQLDAICGSGR